MSEIPLKPLDPPADPGTRRPASSRVGVPPQGPSVPSRRWSGRGAVVRSPAAAPAAGMLRNAVGLVLVVLGGLLAVVAIEQPRPPEWMINTLGLSENYEGICWISAVLLFLAGGATLRARFVPFIVATAAICIATFCANLIAGFDLHWGWMLVGALGLGFLLYARPPGARLDVRSFIGLALVAVAGLGHVRGWFDWTGLSAWLGPTASSFVAEWGVECGWATAMVVVAFGVAFSDTRLTHFLTALLVAAIAYYCIDSGMLRTVHYEQWPDITYRSMHNVESWRWVASSSLGLVALVLLYMSTGIGTLTFVFAIAWMVVGLMVFKSVATMSFARTGWDMYASSGGMFSPLSNMGLPVAPDAGQPAPPVAEPAPTSVGDAIARSDWRQNRQHVVREVTPLVWMLLTSIFAGIIAATGLRSVSNHTAYRGWLTCLLWMGFGAATIRLFQISPPPVEWSRWVDWLLDWTQSTYRGPAFWAVFLGTTAFAGTWALRRESRRDTWMTAGIVCAFLGTAASLLSVFVMIEEGGFPRLPTWVYVMVTAAQSSLMWILLLYMNFVRHPGRTARA